jgi:HD-like signal output (HDOD) protein
MTGINTLDLYLVDKGVAFEMMPKGLPRPPYDHPVSPYAIKLNGRPAQVLLAQTSFLAPEDLPAGFDNFETYPESVISALLERGRLEAMTLLNNNIQMFVDKKLLEREHLVLPTGKRGQYLCMKTEAFVEHYQGLVVPTDFKNVQALHDQAFDVGIYNQKRIEQLGLEDNKIPPFPETARRIIELFQQGGEFPMQDLVEILEQDAPISAQVISWANAAANTSRPGGAIYSVQGAINRLGTNKTLQYAMQSAMSNSFRVRKDLAPMVESACFNSLMSAFGASHVHRLEGGASPQSAYLVGLMHNLGEMLLMHFLSDHAVRFMRLHELNPHLSRESLSREVFRISFASATHLLMKSWRMPQNMVDSCTALSTYNDSGADSLANNVRSWQISVGDKGLVPLSFVPFGWREIPSFPVAESVIDANLKQIADFRTQANMISRRST